MGRPSTLSDGQKLALIDALGDPTLTTADVARRFAIDDGTVRHFRRRAESAEGWSCRLYWTTCIVCGEPVAGGTYNQNTHPACVTERMHRRNLTARAERLASGYDEAAAKREWLEREPGRIEQVRRRKRPASRERARALRAVLSDTERAAGIGALHEQTAELQALTQRSAHSTGEPWTAEEDAILLAWRPRHPPQHELALQLGRTLIAVRHRFHELRKRGLHPAGDPDHGDDA